jgi:hypothetical protein
MSVNMFTNSFMLGTQPTHRATSNSKAAVTVADDWHTGAAVSVGSSPVRHSWAIRCDAGKTKSSANSCKFLF